jgi:hypothetical protein
MIANLVTIGVHDRACRSNCGAPPGAVCVRVAGAAAFDPGLSGVLRRGRLHRVLLDLRTGDDVGACLATAQLALAVALLP